MAIGRRAALLGASLVTFLAAMPISAEDRCFDNWDTSRVDVASSNYGHKYSGTVWDDFYNDCNTCHDDCNVCNDECDYCCGYWIVGTEATFLNPDFSGTGTSATINDTIAVTSQTFAGDADINNLYAGPRLWLGYQGDVWGIVSRYWQLSDSEISYDPVIDFGQAGLSTSLLSENRFNAYTIDLEAVRSWYFYDSKMQVTIGARHGSLDQDSIIVVNDFVNGTILNGTATSFREFHGTGLTLAWGGTRPIWLSDNLNIFWNLRSSVLWGTIRNAAEAQASAAVNGGIATSFMSGDLSEIDEDMFIGEAQLGLQWDHRLRSLPAIAFVRAAAEYQYWDAVGGSATASAGVNLAGGISMDATAESLQMDLIGFSVGTGLMW